MRPPVSGLIIRLGFQVITKLQIEVWEEIFFYLSPDWHFCVCVQLRLLLYNYLKKRQIFADLLSLNLFLLETDLCFFFFLNTQITSKNVVAHLVAVASLTCRAHSPLRKKLCDTENHDYDLESNHDNPDLS